MRGSSRLLDKYNPRNYESMYPFGKVVGNLSIWDACGGKAYEEGTLPVATLDTVVGGAILIIACDVNTYVNVYKLINNIGDNERTIQHDPDVSILKTPTELAKLIPGVADDAFSGYEDWINTFNARNTRDSIENKIINPIYNYFK